MFSEGHSHIISSPLFHTWSMFLEQGPSHIISSRLFNTWSMFSEQGPSHIISSLLFSSPRGRRLDKGPSHSLSSLLFNTWSMFFFREGFQSRGNTTNVIFETTYAKNFYSDHWSFLASGSVDRTRLYLELNLNHGSEFRTDLTNSWEIWQRKPEFHMKMMILQQVQDKNRELWNIIDQEQICSESKFKVDSIFFLIIFSDECSTFWMNLDWHWIMRAYAERYSKIFDFKEDDCIAQIRISSSRRRWSN